MKSFIDLDLKTSYESGENNLVEEFYSPTLECAIKYDRIAGFFSSTSLAIVARGIGKFISNNGKMRIIACPELDKEDIEIIKNVEEDPSRFIEEKLLKEIDDVEDEIANNHIKALGWMLANDYLEMKLAYVNYNGKFVSKNQIEQTGLFHQKVGIMYDNDGNKISFSGSINETAAGWVNNVEEFKVFKSWEPSNVYLENDEKKFNEFWNNKRKNVKTFELTDALKHKMIEKSKSFKLDKLIASEYKNHKKNKSIRDSLNLFSYQKEAIEKWKGNDYQLLFQMATGTGKTRTAMGCIAELKEKIRNLLVIISCPNGTLSLQWKEEIDKIGFDFDKEIIVDGTNKKWKNDLEELILQLSIGIYDNAIIYTTHITGAKEYFSELINNVSKKVEILFIGDEVHGLGSVNNKKGLLKEIKYRVGLSATPNRWFDEFGTKILMDYFGNNTYEFTIHDALTTVNPMTGKTFLVPYVYNLEFVDLTEDELKRYEKLTNEIIKLNKYSSESEEYLERKERLLFKRADIVKDAVNKYGKLEEILDELAIINNMIIFVSSEQIDKVCEILSERKIRYHRFTQETGNKIEKKYGYLTERQCIIENFKKGMYDILVAIKCLDEGIDIPSAQKAILMASSTNPREYVQRIGRVIRQLDGKKEAEIWDISIRPSFEKLEDSNLKGFESSICDKEKNRIYEISENAKNNVEALKKLFDEMGSNYGIE